MDQSGIPVVNDQAASATDRISLLQESFLLGQLAATGEAGKSRGTLNREIGADARRQLGLAVAVANKRRSELLERGYLATKKAGRQISYVLTEAGRAYFTTLEKPVLGERNVQATVDESSIPNELRDAQKAFLLLQLLDAEDWNLTKGQANRIPPVLQSSLGLKPAIANQRRIQLAEQGYIRIKRDGRSEEYVLTADGLDYLTACSKHLDHARFPVRGATLNALIAAARESSFQRDKPAGASGDLPPPSSLDIADAVLIDFEELRREKYGRSGLVPIHEVRQKIADRLGENAARHNVLDDIILDLWRQGKIRLTAISDLRDASERQLDDSIQGESQTYFYLETAHGQPVVL